MSLGNCPICGKPRGGGAKVGRNHDKCSQKLKAQHGDSGVRTADKKLPAYSKSTIDYICKRYDK